ncbi:hypothetical protein MUP59_01930 [Candidatus Bathyarchaeota archaeon]|nr:hypothetical protein [Candidatus Bathyarchaeota archaeon]
MSEKAPAPGRDSLLELALAKGIHYDRRDTTPRRPTKQQILLALTSNDIRNPNEVLSEIQKLKRRLKLHLLQQKAKDLGVYSDYIKSDKLKLAIHIYCKNKTALEDLSKYQKSEPKRKSIFYTSKSHLTLQSWIQKEAQIKKMVQGRLSDENGDSIATLDKLITLGNTIRCEIAIDYKRLIVERKQSPQFPNRKGTYDAYPLRRMIATYDALRNIMQVSPHPEKTLVLMEVFSEALTGSKDNFEIRRPSPEQAAKSFANPHTHKELAENQI